MMFWISNVIDMKVSWIMIVCLLQVHPDFPPPRVSSFFSFISFFSESQSELVYLQEVSSLIKHHQLPH